MRSALFLAVFAVVAGRGGCDPAAPYDPCDGKRCGESCTACPPDDADCAETAVLKACDARGECVMDDGTFACEPLPWDPCAGKACGESCSPCPPEETCQTFAATACDPLGRCATAGTFTCDPPPPLPDPCLGKGCGDPCSTCDATAGMLCPAVMMYCDAAGACGMAYPVCRR